jgi:hypothetical protein
MYRKGNLSYAANHWKVRRRSVFHLIINTKSNEEPPLCSNPSFFRLLSSRALSNLSASSLPTSHPLSWCLRTPWTLTLDKVKKRLRIEQVQLEHAAAARYRRQEVQIKAQETQIGATSSTRCSLLLLLTLACLLFSLTVLVLSTAVLTLVLSCLFCLVSALSLPRFSLSCFVLFLFSLASCLGF